MPEANLSDLQHQELLQQQVKKEAESMPRSTGKSQLENMCDVYRAALRDIEIGVRQFKEMDDMKVPDFYHGQHGEMIAQSMLAVRAIEEARMRLGKVLQYAGDGVSIYDKS